MLERVACMFDDVCSTFLSEDCFDFSDIQQMLNGVAALSTMLYYKD